MADEVNVEYSNFRLGSNVSFQRRLVDQTITWTDSEGTHSDTRTVTFPDVLSNPALLPWADEIVVDIEAMFQKYTRRLIGIDA